MAALLARNVFRACIINERSVPMVLQIRHTDLVYSQTSSVGNDIATGLSILTHIACDSTGIGLSLVKLVAQLGFWRPG
jgi:hypothetical protein